MLQHKKKGKYMGKTASRQVYEMPMTRYNRILNPFLKSIALIKVKRGNIVVIEDEPKTREHKDYVSILLVTMTGVLKMLQQPSTTSDLTTLAPQ